ncbi:MAG TPA: rhomboid family intramembrane serine protease [Pseudomonadales bacterium]|nr:rhomboid family intramembrane serine protease [Pseudomonadales bacterium]
MFPIRDENPTAHRPWITLFLIGANVLVWALLQGFGMAPALADSLCHHALIPGDLLGLVDAGSVIPIGNDFLCRVDGEGTPLTLLSSMFMHGSWLHIIGNLWFLWIFGDNVEDVMGPVRFVAFYLLCGLAAAAAQIVTAPASLVPMIGASGAIGGVMGAYARLYPQARVHMLVFFGFFVTTVSVPALFMLGYWFLLQLVAGLPTLGDTDGGVAFWAHIGGFVTGVALSFVLVRSDRLHARRSRPARPAQRRWF